MSRAIAAILLAFPALAWAQFHSSGKAVTITAPDGGVPVLIQGTISATIQYADGGTQVLDVQGRGGGPLLVTLDSASLAAIAAPTCSISKEPPVISLTTTPTAVPATPLAGRTQLIVKNISATHNAWCCVGSSCTPTSSAAYIILPNGDFQILPVPDTDIVRCRSSTGTVDVNAQEASCE